MSNVPWYIRPEDDERDPWQAEGDAIAMGLAERDHDVAGAALLPDELADYCAEGDEDEDFAESFEQWGTWVLEAAEDQCLALAIEQSCAEGALLPWDMRGVRLQSVPADTLARLHWFFDHCPRHVLVHVVHYMYWLIRSERARRRGTTHWSTKSPRPPLTELDIPPAFKPMRTWPSHWP